ncbi:photosynthetic reaction center subunit H [Rhodocista pekingensis]|uniref:Photosynthetic reaction center subunit H n=1 Tax=Rhodocista pekingensis TaxID=201185 RepID=A0ABW2KWQ3_9PROT
MPTGALTEYMDVAQVALYAFWIFFAGLVYYLHRENKREGYPLVAEDRTNGRVVVQGFPAVPPPKTFTLRNLTTYQAPPGNVDERPIAAAPTAPWPGAPLKPTGNPLVDGVGPAAYAMREDAPDLTVLDKPRIVPIRVAPDHHVDPRDPNPVGMRVLGADNQVAGVVRELWIDRTEPGVRYLEVEVPVAEGTRTVLMPMTMLKIDGARRVVRTGAILASQFADVPGLKNPNQVTKLEEDMITGYFAGGYLYATPARQEPLI